MPHLKKQEIGKFSSLPSTYTHTDVLVIECSKSLRGSVPLIGAKNAVLVVIASLILTDGVSTLYNVPASTDVLHMIAVLKDLGAFVHFNQDLHQLTIDTSLINNVTLTPELMRKMRASVLVMGPLLARFGCANIALPGGCLIGARPIDFHIKNFAKMGVTFKQENNFLHAQVKALQTKRLVFEYPSVGATENVLMAACLAPGEAIIVNAALEPEVLDLIKVLQNMGACIEIKPPATIHIIGVKSLKPITHTIMMDRLEAGGLILAAAITGGAISLPDVNTEYLDVFLEKLDEMGHSITCENKKGVQFKATKEPKAISFRTAPYPGFPTDLQAPMMAALCLAEGKSVVHETVFENRFLHVRELQKMGAQIEMNGDRATITGVDQLYGTAVIATDIRASCALVIAGLAARGKTVMTGLHHWRRGYEALETKLKHLGGAIYLEAPR